MKKQQLLENKQHGTPAFPFECFRTQTDTTDFFIPLHWHKKTELMHVHHGTCLLTIGNETYPAKGGDLFCINAEELHRITSEDATLEYSTFIFQPDLFSFAISDQAQLLLQPLIDGRMQFPTCITDAAVKTTLQPLLHRILQAAEEKAVGYELLVKAVLLQLTAELLYQGLLLPTDPITLEASRNQRERMKKILTYLKQHMTEPLTLSSLADTFHMSEKYFSRYFRNATGQTFTAYLNTIRMNHACQLLLETDDTVLEIALECGYENVSYFIRLFGNLMHCTPLQYRLSKQHRLKQQF